MKKENLCFSQGILYRLGIKLIQSPDTKQAHKLARYRECSLLQKSNIEDYLTTGKQTFRGIFFSKGLCSPNLYFPHIIYA